MTRESTRNALKAAAEKRREREDAAADRAILDYLEQCAAVDGFVWDGERREWVKGNVAYSWHGQRRVGKMSVN